MHVVSYVYDSRDPEPHVERVLDRLDDHDESVEMQDVDAAQDRADGRREAMITVKSAVRIGSAPAELFDADGSPDLTVGALITKAPTGRRTLHVGADALEALQDEG